MPAASCDLPEDPGPPEGGPPAEHPQGPPIWSCSGRGLPNRRVTPALVSSCLTISPLLALGRAVCFCGTFHRVTPPGCYPAPCPVESGLSSRLRRATTRPPLAQDQFTPPPPTGQMCPRRLLDNHPPDPLPKEMGIKGVRLINSLCHPNLKIAALYAKVFVFSQRGGCLWLGCIS